MLVILAFTRDVLQGDKILGEQKSAVIGKTIQWVSSPARFEARTQMSPFI